MYLVVLYTLYKGECLRIVVILIQLWKYYSDFIHSSLTSLKGYTKKQSWFQKKNVREPDCPHILLLYDSKGNITLLVDYMLLKVKILGENNGSNVGGKGLIFMVLWYLEKFCPNSQERNIWRNVSGSFFHCEEECLICLVRANA